MKEDKKIIRGFVLTVVWTIFVMLTLAGLVTAGERTEYITTGNEPETVKSDFEILKSPD